MVFKIVKCFLQYFEIGTYVLAYRLFQEIRLDRFLPAKRHLKSVHRHQNLDDLTLDHFPIVLILSSIIIRNNSKQQFTSKYTDWDKFQEIIQAQVDLCEP